MIDTCECFERLYNHFIVFRLDADFVFLLLHMHHESKQQIQIDLRREITRREVLDFRLVFYPIKSAFPCFCVLCPALHTHPI